MMRKRLENLITLKIEYFTDEEGLEHIYHVQKDFNKVLRFTYNRVCENSNYTTKELTALQANLNNIDLCKSYLKSSAICKGREVYEFNRDSNPQKNNFWWKKEFH